MYSLNLFFALIVGSILGGIIFDKYTHGNVSLFPNLILLFCCIALTAMNVFPWVNDIASISVCMFVTLFAGACLLPGTINYSIVKLP